MAFAVDFGGTDIASFPGTDSNGSGKWLFDHHDKLDILVTSTCFKDIEYERCILNLFSLYEKVDM